MTQETTNYPSNNKLRFSLDLRIVIVLLLTIIVGMLFIWQPWSSDTNTNARTVEVRGEAKLTANPDEFVFYPTYEFKNEDKNTAIAELTSKSNAIVAKLKELGVPESKIKTNSSTYDRTYEPVKPDSSTYTLTLTVTVDNESLAQKVQDYLVTTTPTGNVSPQATFSDTKRKQLESEAREKAIKEARTKADQTAKELGFSIGKVKTVADGTGFSVLPIEAREGGNAGTTTDSKTSLGMHPGENELSYMVTVTYFIH